MQPARILTAALAVSAISAASAGAPATDSIAPRNAVERICAMETERMLRPAVAFEGNPAAMAAFAPTRLSAFGARGEILRQSQAEVVQKGTGHTFGIVEASSYMPLSESATVWGNASFTTGSRRDIRWNNSADYDLVAPYVFGDSVGGDLSTRSYHFSGGYAGTCGPWGWGAEASYTAAIDYRNRDPRDKIVVSDLSVSLGGTRRAGGSHIIGIGGTLRVYNQESDVDFYNPNNDIRAYALTGLGSTYVRFSGTSSLNTAYKGLGGSAALQLLPRGGAGVSANLSIGYLGIGQILRDFNNLELTRSKTYRASVSATWSMRMHRVIFAPALTATATRRLGFENLFGSSVGNNYLMIGTRRNYYADRVAARAAFPLEITLSQSLVLRLHPEMTVRYFHEDYRSPNRALETLSLTPALSAGARWRPDARNMLRVSLGAGRRFTATERRKLPGLDAASSLTQAILSDFHMLTAGHTCLDVKAEYDHGIDGSTAIFITASYRRGWWGRHATSDCASLSAGVKF